MSILARDHPSYAVVLDKATRNPAYAVYLQPEDAANLPKTGTKAAIGILPCVHRGETTGEVVQCQTCAGRVELKVFACGVYTTGCTIAKNVVGKACCQGCPDREVSV